MQCRHIKEDDKHCGAQALRGKKLCFTHDPESSSERKLSHQNGGLARRQYGVYADPITLSTPQDIQKLMELTINGVLTGKIPANQPANTIGFLSHCWLDAYEKGVLTQKVDTLEKRMNNAPEN